MPVPAQASELWGREHFAFPVCFVFRSMAGDADTGRGRQLEPCARCAGSPRPLAVLCFLKMREPGGREELVAHRDVGFCGMLCFLIASLSLSSALLTADARMMRKPLPVYVPLSH